MSWSDWSKTKVIAVVSALTVGYYLHSKTRNPSSLFLGEQPSEHGCTESQNSLSADDSRSTPVAPEETAPDPAYCDRCKAWKPRNGVQATGHNHSGHLRCHNPQECESSKTKKPGYHHARAGKGRRPVHHHDNCEHGLICEEAI